MPAWTAGPQRRKRFVRGQWIRQAVKRFARKVKQIAEMEARLTRSDGFKVATAIDLQSKIWKPRGNEMKSVTNWFWFKRLSSSEHRKAQRMKSPLLVAYYWDGAAPTSHK